MRIDSNTFLTILQVRDIYGGAEGIYTTFEKVYDLLIQDGHQLEYSPEIKAQLWEDAKKRTKWRADLLKKTYTDEQIKTESHKHYKSLLAQKYLLDIKANGGGELFVYDENDPNKTPIRLK